MWFKNALVYRFNKAIDLEVNVLEQRLAEFKFTPCSSQEQQKFGWAGVLSDDLFTHVSDGNILLCARKEEKMLPAQVIKDKLNQKIEKLEEIEQRKLKKTEKDSLKDEVLIDLLPRAFSRLHSTYILIMPRLELVIVDAASSKKAEDALALLRKSIGSLPVIPCLPHTPIENTLTTWVQTGEAAKDFAIGYEATLEAFEEDGAVVKCKKQDLSADEVQQHIQANKFVTQLSLNWQDRIEFMLGQDASLKRLKFSDELKEQNDDIDKSDKAQRFDADLSLMCGEFALFLPSLFDALGGFEAE